MLESLPNWDRDSIHEAAFGLIETLGVKNGYLLWPMRVALSGKQFTPGGGIELAAILGREKSIARIKAALERL